MAIWYTYTVVLIHYQDLFIGGRWTRPSGSEVFESIDPYAGRAWATFPDCDLQDVNDAVAAAKSAFDEGAWRHDGFLRSRLLLRLADLLENEAPRLGAIESGDNGKTVRYGAEWRSSIWKLKELERGPSQVLRIANRPCKAAAIGLGGLGQG